MSASTVLSGKLEAFGLVEVLQGVELGGMTGIIQLKQYKGSTGIIYCNEGKIANASEFDPGALTLGDVLQQLGMATHQHIEAAFRQQLSDAIGKRIGERLTAMRVITEHQLQEALRTKALWTVRELSLWQNGTYEFITSPDVQKLLPYGELPLNIEVMRATMQMINYSDEWKWMREHLPQGMRTMLRLVDRIPKAVNLSRSTVELLLFVNSHRRVRRIADGARRPELDVARELAQLKQQGLLEPFFQDVQLDMYAPYDGYAMRLPDPAEKLRLEHFELLNLLIRMENRWEGMQTPAQQLLALADFVNWTMEALIEACRAKSIELDINMLRDLLASENLLSIGSYQFIIEYNHIDVNDFRNLCLAVLSDRVADANDFYDVASSVFVNILRVLFLAINARTASPRERLENQEAWEAMFEQFAIH